MRSAGTDIAIACGVQRRYKVAIWIGNNGGRHELNSVISLVSVDRSVGATSGRVGTFKVDLGAGVFTLSGPRRYDAVERRDVREVVLESGVGDAVSTEDAAAEPLPDEGLHDCRSVRAVRHQHNGVTSTVHDGLCK